MTISIIVAMSENRVIGRDGDLPWRIPNDLKRFKRLTMGHHIVMGRKTYESIGLLLPGRTTVIVTRQSDYNVPGAMVVGSLPEALQAAKDDDELFIVGGGQIYEQAVSLADRMYLTVVHAQVEGDTYFPNLPADTWQLAATDRTTDSAAPFPYSFQTLTRVE